jgi:hypothetical protein
MKIGIHIAIPLTMFALNFPLHSITPTGANSFTIEIDQPRSINERIRFPFTIMHASALPRFDSAAK